MWARTTASALAKCCRGVATSTKPINTTARKIVDKTLAVETCRAVAAFNGRLGSSLMDTAKFFSGVPLLKRDVVLPTLHQTHVECPTASSVTRTALIVPERSEREAVEDPLVRAPVAEPTDPRVQQPKHAARMIIIRKRKMKVHQRRKRLRKNFSFYRKQWLGREKRKEIAFRNMLMEKVTEAKTFDPSKYVDHVLEDMHKVLIPKTWKGQSKPQWLVKELMAKEELEREQKQAMSQDIITKEKLVLPGETVSQFIERMAKKRV